MPALKAYAHSDQTDRSVRPATNQQGLCHAEMAMPRGRSITPTRTKDHHPWPDQPTRQAKDRRRSASRHHSGHARFCPRPASLTCPCAHNPGRELHNRQLRMQRLQDCAEHDNPIAVQAAPLGASSAPWTLQPWFADTSSTGYAFVNAVTDHFGDGPWIGRLTRQHHPVSSISSRPRHSTPTRRPCLQSHSGIELPTSSKVSQPRLKLRQGLGPWNPSLKQGQSRSGSPLAGPSETAQRFDGL